MDEIQLLKKKKPWYKRWWGILLIVIFGASFLTLPFFVYETVKIYKEMRAGTYVSNDIVKEKAPYDMDKLVDEMSPTVGSAKAQVKVVEFGDFNCSNTLAAFPIVREMMTKYKDKIKFYWRNYPVVKESSMDFAKAGVCANKQGKFWPFHDRMFQLQGSVTLGNLEGVAQKANLDLKLFRACLADQLTLAQLRKDYYAAQDGAVRGTPTFFVNGFKIEGPIPLAMWVKIIDKFLSVYETNKGD